GARELFDTGWHAAYRLLTLAEAANQGTDVRPIEVCAMLSNQHIKDLLPGEDTGQLLVRFSDGMHGSLLTSWAFDGEPDAWQFRVSGQHGMLAGGIRRLVFAPSGWGAAPAEWRWDPTPGPTYVPQVTPLLDVVLDGVASRASWRHAARTLQLIRGGYLAADQRRTVDLPSDPTQL